MTKNWDPKKTYEILGRHFDDGPWISLYVGPLRGNLANLRMTYAQINYRHRMVRRAIKDVEVLAMVHGHPDLLEMDRYTNQWYPGLASMEGEVNRATDPEIRSAVRRRVAPFDSRAEDFYANAGEIFSAAEEAAILRAQEWAAEEAA